MKNKQTNKHTMLNYLEIVFCANIPYLIQQKRSSLDKLINFYFKQGEKTELKNCSLNPNYVYVYMHLS